MRSSYGLPYQEYLESVGNPGMEKYKARYKGRIHPAPVLKSDTEIIKSFLDDRIVDAGISAGSAKAEAGFLCSISRRIPDFNEMDTKRAGAAFLLLRQEMKPNSARRAMQCFRTFIQWMHDENVNTKISLEKIQKIKSPSPNYDTKKASNMLTGKDLNALLEACTNDRDRAFIAMMYEGSLRPIEVITAVWSDLNFDKYGAQFSTSKKTGKPRYIRLILAAPYLLKWKNNYPNTITSESPIFVSAKHPHEALTRGGLKSIFDVIVNRSGIKKKITPYYMRHSRITAMINDEIPDSVVKLQAWGSLRSNMLATYAHIGNHDVDRILLTRAGIVTESEQEKDESLKSRQCPNCGKVHTPSTKFCDECGAILTKEAKQQVEQERATIRASGSEYVRAEDVEAIVKKAVAEALTGKK